MSPSAAPLPGTLDLPILEAVSMGGLHGCGLPLRIGQIAVGALALRTTARET